jgi:hypothetical protein
MKTIHTIGLLLYATVGIHMTMQSTRKVIQMVKHNKSGVPRKKIKKRRVKKGEKGTYRKKDGKLSKKR